jgi:hypothetical protein
VEGLIGYPIHRTVVAPNVPRVPLGFPIHHVVAALIVCNLVSPLSFPGTLHLGKSTFP